MVDGTLDEQELAVATGMPPEDLADQLERLAMMGVIALETSGEVEGGRVSSLPDELPDDGIQLAMDARKHIDALYGLLDQADYYELLGVTRDATKGDIKAAYYRIGPGFHPDKHFGKDIGAFKSKIESIFTLLTRAHDTLRYNKRRQSYDAALPPPRAGAKQRREAVAAAAAYFAGLSDRRSKSKRPSTPSEDSGGESGRPAARAGSPPPLESYTAPRSGAPPEGRRSSSVTERAQRPPTSPSDSSTPPGRSVPAPATHRPPTTRRPSVTGRPPGTGRPPADPADPPPGPAAATGPQPAAAPARAEPRPPPPPMTEEERRIQRDTLAKKLRSRGAPPVAVTRHRRRQTVAPKVSQRDPATLQAGESVDRSASEVLRDRYSAIATAAKKRRLDRYLEQGRVAMAAGDYRAASAAYTQAQKLSPDDREIADLAERSVNLARQMGE